MITLSLPIPVSVNHAYANAGKGRVKTPGTKLWAVQAQYQLVTDPAIKALAAHRAACQQMRDKCIVRMGSRVKVSIYELRKLFNGRYRIEYRYFFPDDNLRDMLNFEKLLTDFLVEHHFMVDDQFIIDARQRTMPPDPKNPRVEIDIFSLDLETAKA